ncbi:MAG TPA: single-stranded DNA-binding protein [Flavobacteriaceae bacterium]|nr:single-stranded DNA-binding protein [Flavobacteriaceae bacterium]
MASQGSLNKVMLIGNVGTEIKMHYFDGGGCIGNLSLATNEAYVNKSTNQKIVNTEWHNIVVRNKLAEIFEKHVKVGDKLYVEGRIKTRKWKDDQGLDRYTTEIQVSEFTFLSTKNEERTPNEQKKVSDNAQRKE